MPRLILALLMTTATASAQEASLIEHGPDKNPFASIEVRNLCAPRSSQIAQQRTFETIHGPVTIEFREHGNRCFEAPDTFRVVELPPGVAADPKQVDLIERQDIRASDYGYIHLYTFQGM